MSEQEFLKEYNSLPRDYKKEVNDFIAFLKLKLKRRQRQVSQERRLGRARGKASMSPDFDAPLDDMQEYME